MYGEKGQKILNAWSTFILNSNKTILNVDFIDTDLSSESDEVKSLANILLTDDVKAAWKANLIANKPGA